MAVIFGQVRPCDTCRGCGRTTTKGKPLGDAAVAKLRAGDRPGATGDARAWADEVLYRSGECPACKGSGLVPA